MHMKPRLKLSVPADGPCRRHIAYRGQWYAYLQMSSYRSENAKLHSATEIFICPLQRRQRRKAYSAIARGLGVPRDTKARYLKAL